MQITRTSPKGTVTRSSDSESPVKQQEAPVEISVDDVVYIRSDAAGRDSGKSDRLSKTFKVASAALVGGACGAVPVVGFVPTALAGLTMQDDSPVFVGLGGALLNIAGTVGWHLTKDPLFMVAPALTGALAWGLKTSAEI